ncbi:bifunctional UDP-N-acetylglucosamine diphosphorylase/glucosamine-1-phosphate N-acetyltransferase GlmU [Paraconexibacter antarcticus]|uniref:Bifunctional protein GlmU n=1 Tax=Paraconexibacter antarcticus TaxID=2949664 RepID=A0ABY5DN30_9ACTN|nr:bifunctional UDP-N-acetylglucosamine diphosphorylase/glucosamine-1-phosphate N-acetyltransferase GlmU [Paraconexibacter antarcticus]UTI63441.1 bifunctional UDP-N-acetylglucosamine diphosphorylase/glucosamine-1-phosphate N-acetyltransferase GlmU [Paraconexibacter antarcticus]
MSFSAVVMAAGQGTRMRSKTPKVLHEICGRPMVHWPVLAARTAGAATIVVVGSPDGSLEAHLPEGVAHVVQPIQDGTGGAVAAATGALPDSGPVVILSGDVPLITAEAIRALVDAHAAGGAAATMVTAILDDATGYGRVVRAADGSVEAVVETKADGDATPEQLQIREVNTGIFCFDAAALRSVLPRVGTDNAQHERYLPDTLPLLRADGLAVAAHVIDDPAMTAGINDRVQLAQVTAAARARILEAHMRAGVTVIDPGTTDVDVTVTIGQDTLLEPGTVLRGATHIGAGCRVGPQVTLTDCTLRDNVTIRHAFGVEATAHDDVTIGPYAYLRPGTVLRERAKAGTFVEIKNSDIGAGAKVPHLSYIGDADVGEGTNLGAATITANYDGRHKHRTTIGRDVRSGVDVTFVAPVTVGDRAVTGAGSVITKDVAAGALGIARARQTNLEDYADRQHAPDTQDGNGA